MAESGVKQQQPEILNLSLPCASVEKQEGQSQQSQQSQKKLMYLEFVHLAAMQAVVYFSTLYSYAKEISGPLKPGVETVESTVKSVIVPVYDKFYDVPYEILKFVDKKVDESLTELERHVPSAVKAGSTQVYAAAQKAAEVARSVAREVQHAGLVGTAMDLAKGVASTYQPTAKLLYARYEPVAEHYAVATWRFLNRLPLFLKAAQIMVPTAAYWSEKYNSAVSYGAQKGYAVAAYLPLVPTERIAKVFGSPGAEASPAEAQ